MALCKAVERRIFANSLKTLWVRRGSGVGWCDGLRLTGDQVLRRYGATSSGISISNTSQEKETDGNIVEHRTLEASNHVQTLEDDSTFQPREKFELPSTMPKSYYLGHHVSGLRNMRKMLSNVDLIVECRDYRIPLSSRNPTLERALANVPRIIVYTHADLGRADQSLYKTDNLSSRSGQDRRRETLLRKHENALAVHFVSNQRPRTTRQQVSFKDEISNLYETMREFATSRYDVTGKYALITGIPNVGKSTLLNSLRTRYSRSSTSAKRPSKSKVAQTGGQPGVTRKIGTAVKIIDGSDDAGSSAMYVLDTPGVFVPYVPDAFTFLKLALCGCVKENLVPPLILADYLLYRLNLISPSLYTSHTGQGPTNDIIAVLTAITQRTGRGLIKLRPDSFEGASFEDPLDEMYSSRARTSRRKRQEIDYEAVATWMVQQWRSGRFGNLVLDEVKADMLGALQRHEEVVEVSQSQALKMERERRKSVARGKQFKAST